MRNTILSAIILSFAVTTAMRAQDVLYIQSPGDTLTAIPSDYVLCYNQDDDGVSVMLTTGKSLLLPGAFNVTQECPVAMPRFASYRFNNKHNDQLFQDAIASEDELQKDTVHLSVAQIGKYLTASFKLSDDDAQAWVGTTRQVSKVSRQRMESPVTYTLGHEKWRQLQIAEDEIGGTSYSYIPFGRQVTVSVDFLTDHPTGQYNVPRIDITTANGLVPVSKENYIEATISIDGGGVYPDMPTTDMLIKGRGNSSWGQNNASKNPYHFKFAEKMKPLGMKAGKHWILLSNKQAGSMMCNALEQKASALAGCAAPCHIVPVELYINGKYRGSYNLTEKVGFHNNSVSLDDESCAAMLELDTYDDEEYWWYNAYWVETKIHDPDFEDGDEELSFDEWDVISDWQTALNTLRYGEPDEYTGCFNVDYLVSYLFANELCFNSELKHPKSVFLYSENVLDNGFELTGIDDTPWIFGPMWDCDWSFGYNVDNNNGTYFVDCAQTKYYDVWLQPKVLGLWYDLRYRSQIVDKAYYTLWYKFMNDGRMQELIDYVQDYYDYAAPSLKHNSKSVVSERDGTNYLVIVRRAVDWFRKRANFVFNSLTPYDIEEDPEPTWPVPYIIDTKDAIHLASSSSVGDGIIYNLAGQRASNGKWIKDNGQLKPGIYIIGGRKVVVK